jgi:hypothetical protein
MPTDGTRGVLILYIYSVKHCVRVVGIMLYERTFLQHNLGFAVPQRAVSDELVDLCGRQCMRCHACISQVLVHVHVSVQAQRVCAYYVHLLTCRGSTYGLAILSLSHRHPLMPLETQRLTCSV